MPAIVKAVDQTPPLGPPFAEWYVTEEDVERAIEDGLRGDALLQHLGAVAGRAYATAKRAQPPKERKPGQPVPRGLVVQPRPVQRCRSDGLSEVLAVREYRFTGRLPWVDGVGFLEDVGGA